MAWVLLVSGLKKIIGELSLKRIYSRAQAPTLAFENHPVYRCVLSFSYSTGKLANGTRINRCLFSTHSCLRYKSLEIIASGLFLYGISPGIYEKILFAIQVRSGKWEVTNYPAESSAGIIRGVIRTGRFTVIPSIKTIQPISLGHSTPPFCNLPGP